MSNATAAIPDAAISWAQPIFCAESLPNPGGPPSRTAGSLPRLALAVLLEVPRRLSALPLDVSDQGLLAHQAAEEDLEQERAARSRALLDRLFEPGAKGTLALLRDAVDLLVRPALLGDAASRRE